MVIAYKFHAIMHYCYVIMQVQLAIRPTPIHHWDLPGVPKEFQVFIKRDDMTGSTLGGNKVYIKKLIGMYVVHVYMCSS